MAGCSGTPLPRRLGTGAGRRGATAGAPTDLATTFRPIEEDAVVEPRQPEHPAGLRPAFVEDRAVVVPVARRAREAKR